MSEMDNKTVTGKVIVTGDGKHEIKSNGKGQGQAKMTRRNISYTAGLDLKGRVLTMHERLKFYHVLLQPFRIRFTN